MFDRFRGHEPEYTGVVGVVPSPADATLVGPVQDGTRPIRRPGWGNANELDSTAGSAQVPQWQIESGNSNSQRYSTMATTPSTACCLGPLLHMMYRYAMISNPQVQGLTYLKAIAAFVLGFSVVWLANYLFIVLPAIEEYWPASCKYNNAQLMNTARLLFFYFVWFACARLLLFVPRVAQRFGRITVRTHGFCRSYCLYLFLRDGPLYIFVLGSLLFWVHLLPVLPSSICQLSNPKFYRALRLYAMYNNLLGVLCLIFAFWHNRVLTEIASGGEVQMTPSGAPPGTIDKFEICPYDSSVFGDEDGKKYPSDCAICLGTWESDDIIKVTPCGHAFHEECVGNWLKAASTCALCRRDVTTANSALRVATTPSTSLTAHGGSLGLVPNPQTVGTPATITIANLNTFLEEA